LNEPFLKKFGEDNKYFEELMEDWWCDEERKVKKGERLIPFTGTQETLQDVEYYDMSIVW
jgi:hypothetical protein